MKEDRLVDAVLETRRKMNPRFLLTIITTLDYLFSSRNMLDESLEWSLYRQRETPRHQ
jgi:hypothetical protein